MADQHPLTCEFDNEETATELLVVDWPTGRAKHLICQPCTERAPTDIRRLRRPFWRFSLVAQPAQKEEIQ